MEENKNLLQIKIASAISTLSKETKGAINDINWKFIILGMSQKYSQDQLENLETETELLLSGIIGPNEYQKELEQAMALSKENVALLLGEMDKLIFKKIQERFLTRLSGDEKAISSNSTMTNRLPESSFVGKSSVIDPRFIGLPNDLQQAIIKSNWKQKLYEIVQKYKINIEEMAILEDITVKVMLNEIHSDQYGSELSSKLTIPKENISNIVKEANDNIFKKIRESLETPNETGKGNTTDDIPLPPYASIKPKVEIVQKQPEIIPIPKPEMAVPTINNTPKDIIEEKLQGATASAHTVSDYSTPQNPGSIVNIKKDIDPTVKSHDPYREIPE